METVTIRGKRWLGTRVTQPGITIVSELPGDIMAATLTTKGPGKLQVVGTENTEVLTELVCQEGQQEVEKVLPQPKRHQGFCVLLEGENAEGVIYHKPLDVSKSIARIEEILEQEFQPQWVQKHEFSLATATTNKKLDQFPSSPKYLYVKENSGSATAKFDSLNEEAWSLTTKDQYQFPFQKLYLTWTAQAGEKLVFCVSNREIKRTTLA